jgi:hypothetical protein
MMLSHAGALAFVTGCTPTGRRALLLLPERLDNVDFAEPLEALRNECIEPSLWNFPKAPLSAPLRNGTTFLAYPGAVRAVIRNSHTEAVSRTSSQQYRDFLLIPNAAKPFGRIRVQSEPRFLSWAQQAVGRISAAPCAVASYQRNDGRASKEQAVRWAKPSVAGTALRYAGTKIINAVATGPWAARARPSRGKSPPLPHSATASPVPRRAQSPAATS